MKKVTSILLAFVLCFSLSTTIFAINREVISVDQTTVTSITSVLEAIELQKEDFGFTDIDFTSISLGNEIPSYELTESGLSRLGKMHFFPIFSNNSWFATAIVYYNDNGDISTEISAKYAKEYNSMEIASTKIGMGNDVALLFDNSHTYFYTDDSFSIIDSFPEVNTRISLSDLKKPVYPVGVNISPSKTIELDLPPLSLNSVLVNDDTFGSLEIPIVTQPTKTTCWAACMAMILKYKGISATVSSVVSAVGLDMSSYCSASKASYYFTETYGYNCGTYGNSYGFYREKLTLANIKTEILFSEVPLFAGFGDRVIGHAVIIKGYTNLGSAPTMTYIDPADGYIKSSAIPSSGLVTIPYSGSTHDFEAAFAVYDKAD